MKPGLRQRLRAALQWPGAGLLAPAGLLALQAWPGLAELLRFTRAAHEAGAYWQLFSAQLVHLNGSHAVLNVLVLGFSCWLWRHWLAARQQALALAGGMLGVAAILVLDASCLYYAGLSGALHGQWAGNALALWAAQTPTRSWAPGTNRERAFAVIVLLFLVAKLAWEAQEKSQALAWLDLPVYRPAHLAGAVGGLILVTLGLLLRALPARDPQPQREQ